MVFKILAPNQLDATSEYASDAGSSGPVKYHRQMLAIACAVWVFAFAASMSFPMDESPCVGFLGSLSRRLAPREFGSG